MSDTNHHVLTGKVDITSNLLVGSSHLFVDTNNNRVGLVTTNPDAGLHVNSNVYVNTDVRVGPAGPNQVIINDSANPGRIVAKSFVGDGSGLNNVPLGPAGPAATVDVGTTTTGAAGSSASVTNSGTTSAAVFDFTIPKGDQGIQGIQGIQGVQGVQGVQGPSGTITVGTVTTVTNSSGASVTNSGTSENAVLNFNIPVGADSTVPGPTGPQGIQGLQGPQGPAGADGADGTNYFTLSGSNIYRSTGNVGIGTTYMACRLDIAGEDVMIRGNTPSLNFSEGTNGMDGAFRIHYDGANQVDGNNFLAIQYGTNFADTSLHCTLAGNVGIQTSSPGSTLDVHGGVTSPIKKTAPSAATNTYNFILNGPRPGTTTHGATHFINGSTRSDDGGNNTYTIRNDSGPLRLGHGSYNTVIDGSSVGIGVTSPDNKLEVRGNIQASWDDTNHGFILEAGGTLRRDYGGYGAGFHFTGNAIWPTNYLGSYNNGGIDFGNSSYRWNNIWTEALNTNGDITCTSNMYFGSGTRQHLNLYGSTYGLGVQGATLYLRSSGNFIFYKGGSHNNSEGNAGGGTEIANFNRNGWTYLRQNVQITGEYLEQYNQRRSGSGSYPTRLHWQNNGHHIDCYYNSSGHDFHINYYSGQNVYLRGIANSDRRIKKNIKDINDVSALDTLRKLQPKTYEYKLKPERGVVYGFIAQEVKEVLPYATSVTTLSAPFEAEDFINATFEKLEDEKMTVTLENPLNPKYPIQPGINLLFKVGPNETMDYKILEIVDDTHIIIDNDKHDLPTIQPILVGSQVNDFHGLEKDAIFTVATAALQEVDRQLQSEKKKVATMELLVASLLSRVGDLEKRIA